MSVAVGVPVTIGERVWEVDPRSGVQVNQDVGVRLAGTDCLIIYLTERRSIGVQQVNIFAPEQEVVGVRV